MTTRETVLLTALLLGVATAVVLYVLAPAGRAAWLATITLGAIAAGLVLARAGRVRRAGAP